MTKILEDLKWKPLWTTHIGCIKGCLDYLKMNVSDAWLFGATGHAFIINIHEVVCPSGPTAWKTERMFELGKNTGYTIDGVFTHKQESDFERKKELAWEMTRNALDKNLPCYGWELEIPEFYVVNGYDDEGYHYSGPKQDESKSVKPWKELGESDIGIIEMYSVKPSETTNPTKTVKDAFEFALEHSKSPSKWILPKYKAGLDGYDLWISALESGTADGFGMAYNSPVWTECREHAVKFLEEAKGRVDEEYGPLFDVAVGRYEEVAKNLKSVTELFPFPPEGDESKDKDRCVAAADYLRVARKAEESGLGVLERILSTL